jgi:hypothetical protein
MSDFAGAALPAATALIGIGVGWVAGRGRERRDMRVGAYLEWMRAARLVLTWPIGEPPPTNGAMVPHPMMQLRLVDAVAEVELVGSATVVAASRAYLESVDETAERVGQQGVIYNDLVKAIDGGLRPKRRAVVDLMRRDLKTKK